MFLTVIYILEKVIIYYGLLTFIIWAKYQMWDTLKFDLSLKIYNTEAINWNTVIKSQKTMVGCPKYYM